MVLNVTPALFNGGKGCGLLQGQYTIIYIIYRRVPLPQSCCVGVAGGVASGSHDESKKTPAWTIETMQIKYIAIYNIILVSGISNTDIKQKGGKIPSSQASFDV